MTGAEVETFARCIGVGGVALFPSDTVYGLATDPESDEGAWRIYRLKGRPPAKPAAVMFFDRELALAALPELGRATAAALATLLPGAVTLLLPNPRHRYPLACGTEADSLGVRVPRLDGALAPLVGLSWPVLQTSANVAGGADPRTVAEVPSHIREGVDVSLDAGRLPGTPSTIVDLRSYEAERAFRIVREGAVSADAVAAALA